MHITPPQARELANQDVTLGLTPQHLNAIRSLAEQVEALTNRTEGDALSIKCYQAQVDDLAKERDAAIKDQRCECSSDDACRFAVERAAALALAAERLVDAERYKFVSLSGDVEIYLHNQPGIDNCKGICGEGLDAAIDAARQAAKDAS